MRTSRALTVIWDTEEPVYEQIARQIRESVVAGELLPGAALPSVRTLASDLGVNLNTVARAYRLLEEQGFVVIRDRSGAEVAAPQGSPDATAGSKLAAQLRDLLVRMRQAGVPRDAVERALDAVFSGGDGTPHRKE